MTNKLLYDEKTLLIKVAGGDESAFARLFEQWHPMLAAYIYRVTRSREMAAEIVQDVFLKIWISRETLGSVNNFKAYLLIVSRNHAINALRKSMRELQQKKTWQKENTEPVPGPEENPDMLLYSIIDEAIDHLPPRQKEVSLLHRYQRLTYLRIAEKLGIGRESVKTHMELAIKSITRYLRRRITIGILLFLLFQKVFQ